MADLERKIAEAREAVERPWTDERVDRVAGALEARRRRRVVRRATAATLAIVAALGASWRLFAPPAGLHIAPGVTARLLEGGEVRTIAVADDLSTVELVHGGARFDVARHDGRMLRVRSGGAAIEIASGRVIVASSATEVRVTVVAGEARITVAGQTHTIAAGHRETFSLSAPPAPKSTAPAPTTANEVEPVVTPSVTAVAKPAAVRAQRSWRTSAEQGDFDKAYDQLARSGPHAVRDVPAELLLAADVARLSHHPAEAVSPLERVVRDHARDPRAPLAAFTLGRVLLDELGRPQQAAAAFAKSRALASDGPLAADALSREVEAWSRAGDLPRARQRGEEYLQRYPKGARINSVRRFGGLD